MTKPGRTDDYYANAYANFVSKFECAVNRIASKEIKLSTTVNYIQMSKRWPHRGLIKIHGPQYSPGHWFIPNIPNMIGLHPFELMLEGRYTRTEHVETDIEMLFGFDNLTIQQAFYEGFMNEPSYKDIWENSYHWSVGAAFHVGRYLLNKHAGTKLSCKIPTILKTRGIIK